MFSCELLITFIASTGPRNKSLTMKDFPHFDLIASETDSKIFKAFRYVTCMLIILQCHQGRQSQNQKVQLFVSRSLKCLCSVLCGPLGKKAEIVKVMFHDVTVASKALSCHIFHRFSSVARKQWSPGNSTHKMHLQEAWFPPGRHGPSGDVKSFCLETRIRFGVMKCNERILYIMYKPTEASFTSILSQSCQIA